MKEITNKSSLGTKGHNLFPPANENILLKHIWIKFPTRLKEIEVLISRYEGICQRRYSLFYISYHVVTVFIASTG